jgi:hypothetical protein
MNLRGGLLSFFMIENHFLPVISILGIIMNLFFLTSLADKELNPNCTYAVVALSIASRCDTRAL